MQDLGGMEKPELKALPHIDNRITFIYLERCKINREDSAITVRDQEGVMSIPAAMISVLMLGPGTDISHRAVELISDAGVTVVWVGEHGVKYYSCGKPLTNHSTLLVKQAEYVSNEKKHIMVARKMYQLRFPDEDVSGLSMQQLRGREGSRIRKLYRDHAKQWGIKWFGRNYTPGRVDDSDLVNQAMTIGNSCLYGLALSVISALGCSPGLGFIHVGHELSFVYDVADLYKAEITIPVAFEMAATNKEDFKSTVRRRIRDEFKDGHLIDRMVRDIKYLFSDASEPEDYSSTLYLWDNLKGNQKHGILYQAKEENK